MSARSTNRSRRRGSRADAKARTIWIFVVARRNFARPDARFSSRVGATSSGSDASRSSERAEDTPDDERDKLNEDGDVGDLGGECKLAREVDIWSDLFLARAARWSTGFSFRECHSFCGCWSSSSKKGFSTSA